MQQPDNTARPRRSPQQLLGHVLSREEGAVGWVQQHSRVGSAAGGCLAVPLRQMRLRWFRGGWAAFSACQLSRSRLAGPAVGRRRRGTCQQTERTVAQWQ